MEYPILYSLQTTFTQMWSQVLFFIPELVAAFLVMVVAVIVAGAFKRVIESVAKRLRINAALNAAGFDDLMKKADLHIEVGAILGTLVKWFVLLMFFVVALDILNLDAVNVFLREQVLTYVPHVIVAVLILIVASIVANLVRRSVVSFAKVAGLRNAELFGKVSYLAIVVLAVLAALNELQVATELIQPLFWGVMFAISLAVGLAFGLGGREAASRVIETISRKN